jgi:hypothetical protein
LLLWGQGMDVGLPFPAEFNKECSHKPIPFAFVPRTESDWLLLCLFLPQLGVTFISIPLQRSNVLLCRRSCLSSATNCFCLIQINRFTHVVGCASGGSRWRIKAAVRAVGLSVHLRAVTCRRVCSNTQPLMHEMDS